MGEFVAVAQVPSPIGALRLAATRTGLLRLGLPRGGGAGFSGWLRRHVPDGERVASLPALDAARAQLDAYFAGQRLAFDVPLDLRGTPFQLRCWQALLEIPLGQTRSYGEIARAVGRPRAVRAVGAANGANPIPLLVPCHRVIASDGKLGGYGGGLETKRKLLAFEQTLEPRALL
ncbi:MAG: methylated-DNA--[protein]-cysteine S-methyltransferase [Myxococcota bacterium]